MGRVLVVDDEEGIRVLCRVNLELGGFEVVEAGDGPEALERARSCQPDLILLDVMMPGMDGWEVLARLKSDDATAAIPVVLLTARSAEEDQIRAWGEGVADYLTKPFNPTALVEWVRDALQRETGHDEATRRARIIEQLELLRDMRRQP